MARRVGPVTVLPPPISSTRPMHPQRFNPLPPSVSRSPATAPVLTAARTSLRDRLVSAEGLDDLPEVEWLIDGLLPKDSFVLLYGIPGCGKSFLALDWAFSVGSRRPNWLGHSIAGNGQPVLYIVAEGARGIRQRRQAWETAHGVT